MAEACTWRSIGKQAPLKHPGVMPGPSTDASLNQAAVVGWHERPAAAVAGAVAVRASSDDVADQVPPTLRAGMQVFRGAFESGGRSS